MGLKIQYIPVEGGAAVLSCTGPGSALCLPEEIEGLAVREICAYAFSSPEAAEHLPAGTEIRTAETGSPAAPGSAEKFLGGPALQEIILPRGIRSIGEYAFYNCVSLCRIGLGEGDAQVGNGAFMNCGSLGRIDFSAPPDAETCLSGLLTEIQREVRVTFRSGGETAAWIFPEYYEESVENAPARIFEHFIHGAGYRYRQCFNGSRLEAEDYDAQFFKARAEAEPATALRIALVRLRCPYRLLEAAKNQYLFHLKENAAAAAELLIADDDPEGLAFLAARGILTRESIGSAVEAAARKGRAECLSILLNEQHTRFTPREKSFEL
jgi:hypothetical protein